MQCIRLDYIQDIEHEYTERMRELRSMFIDLDMALMEIEDDDRFNPESGALRTLALARTHLETSSMYAIKSLCLTGEIQSCSEDY